MATKTPTPAPARQHPADRIGHVMVVVGSMMHSIGSHILRDRNTGLAGDLERARAEVGDLYDYLDRLGMTVDYTVRRGTPLMDFVEPVTLDEHQAPGVDEHQATP